MTIFQYLIVILILAFIVLFGVLVIKKDGITFNYKKTITTITKLDEIQLEIAKQNLEELKKYNENASKQTEDTSKAIVSMTTAVQELMGVNNDESEFRN